MPATLLDVAKLAMDGRDVRDAVEWAPPRTEDWPYFWIEGFRLTGGLSCHVSFRMLT
jgi:hypothetical protein